MNQPDPRIRRVAPQAFCAAAAFPWPLIADLAEGHEVVACYVVLDRQRRTTRQDKPFLQLQLGDRTGSIAAMIWEEADRFHAHCAPEDFVGIRGRIGSYGGKPQLIVEWLEPLEVASDDLPHFLPASPRDFGEMERELDALIRSVRDAGLRTLLRRCLGSHTPSGRAFRSSPAAKRHHHAYVGGLLEHSLSVAGTCHRLVAHYQGQGYDIDRDLLITGALLHDVGKIREFQARPGFGYTDAGQLLGHIVLGLQIVAREGDAVPELDPERLLLVQHLIASHHGKHEWASPVTPRIVEALVLHHADDLDAKLFGAHNALAAVQSGEWTAYNARTEQTFFRTPSQQLRESSPAAELAPPPVRLAAPEPSRPDSLSAETRARDTGADARTAEAAAPRDLVPIFDLFDG